MNAAASANTALFDAAVRHAVLLERLKAGEAKRLLAAWVELEADLLARLARHDPTAVKGRFATQRLQRLLVEVSIAIEAFCAGQWQEFAAGARALAAAEAEFAAASLAAAVPLPWDWGRPAPAQLWAAVNARPMQGRHLREWYRALEAVTADRVRAAIRMGVIEGQPTPQIGQRIRAATAMSRRGAEMVARTAIAHVAQVAQQKVADENAGIVKGVRWVSTLDTRTSAVCRARDGQLFPLDSGPRPPAHPNCRSTTGRARRGMCCNWKIMNLLLRAMPGASAAP